MPHANQLAVVGHGFSGEVGTRGRRAAGVGRELLVEAAMQGAEEALNVLRLRMAHDAVLHGNAQAAQDAGLGDGFISCSYHSSGAFSSRRYAGIAPLAIFK